MQFRRGRRVRQVVFGFFFHLCRVQIGRFHFHFKNRFEFIGRQQRILPRQHREIVVGAFGGDVTDLEPQLQQTVFKIFRGQQHFRRLVLLVLRVLLVLLRGVKHAHQCAVVDASFFRDADDLFTNFFELNGFRRVCFRTFLLRRSFFFFFLHRRLIQFLVFIYDRHVLVAHPFSHGGQIGHVPPAPVDRRVPFSDRPGLRFLHDDGPSLQIERLTCAWNHPHPFVFGRWLLPFALLVRHAHPTFLDGFLFHFRVIRVRTRQSEFDAKEGQKSKMSTRVSSKVET